MNWQQELLKKLDALADKLGTTGAYLWHVLVRQGIVEGVTSLLLSALFVTLAWIAAKTAVRVFKEGNAFADKNRGADWQARHFVEFIPAMIVFVVMGIAGVANLVYGIQYLCNPEFYALQRVLETLK